MKDNSLHLRLLIFSEMQDWQKSTQHDFSPKDIRNGAVLLLLPSDLLYLEAVQADQYSILYFVYFEPVNSDSAGLIYESRQPEQADGIYETKWA